MTNTVLGFWFCFKFSGLSRGSVSQYHRLVSPSFISVDHATLLSGRFIFPVACWTSSSLKFSVSKIELLPPIIDFLLPVQVYNLEASASSTEAALILNFPSAARPVNSNFQICLEPSLFLSIPTACVLVFVWILRIVLSSLSFSSPSSFSSSRL